jgi:hypothetical protein
LADGGARSIKKIRIAGLMLRRDWGKHAPWPNYPKEGGVAHEPQDEESDPAAELRDELTFTSFRHRGFTETADAEWTDGN